MTTMPTAVVPVSSMHVVSQGNNHRVLPARPMRCWELASFEVDTKLETCGKELVQITVEYLGKLECYVWIIRADTDELGITSPDESKKIGPVDVWFVFDPDNGCKPIAALGGNEPFYACCEDREAATARWEEWRRSIAR